MPENISVKKAIWNGRLTVSLPTVNICLWIISIGINTPQHDRRIITVISILCIPTILFCHAALATKWYVWALNSVRNVHELRQKAVFERLIPYKNNFFSKSGVALIADKEKIASLEKKFNVPDEFINDPGIPAETKIYISKAGKIFMLLVMIACFIAGITLISVAHIYIIGGIMCIISGYLVFDSYKKISNHVPQIVLSNQGIETTTSGFHSWKEIANEMVGLETDEIEDVGPNRRSTLYYLAYDFNKGNEKVYLYGLYTNHWRLAKLLKVYRGRSL